MASLRTVPILLALVPFWNACGPGDAAPPLSTDPMRDSGSLAERAPDVSAQQDALASDQGSAETSDAGAEVGPNDGAADRASDSVTAETGADADASDTAADATGLEKTDPYPAVVCPMENPCTDSKALLGKVLFWEEQIGSKNNMACGTCHRAAGGGSDPRAAEPASLGAGPDGVFGTLDDVHGGRGIQRCDTAGMPDPKPPYGLMPQVTVRKPPTYFDAMFAPELFWDGRARTQFVDPVTNAVAIVTGGALESQAAGPPVNDVEMSCQGYTWRDIETKLAMVTPLTLARNIPKAMADFIANNTYPQLFQQVYGSTEITARKIIFAIATHERTLTSNQTSWDRFNAGTMIALTLHQQQGLALFNTKARCNKCHQPPLFTDDKFHNIGLNAPSDDPGRSAISGNPDDLGKMKTPTLRNVGLRAPGGMMHSGTGNGATMDAVMNEYNLGGIDKVNLDPEMKAVNLAPDEIDAVTDFMVNGLTDPRVLNRTPPFDSPTLSTEP